MMYNYGHREANGGDIKGQTWITIRVNYQR